MTSSSPTEQGKGETEIVLPLVFCMFLVSIKKQEMHSLAYMFHSVSDPDSESGSGSRRAKITHKKRKKLRNFMFEVLDVLF